MSEDLLIKISADTAEAVSKMSELGGEGEKLENKLSEVAKISAVAFAALSAEVAVSVKAFADSENASLALSNALQNQGIYTDELKASYKAYAEEVSSQTGISTVQIAQAQTVAQQYLGQIPITQKLTSAIADLAQAQGISLTQAAEQMGKAIGNGTGMLLRQGLQISATSTEAERYGQVLDFVNAKYGGAAEAIDPVTLATKKLGVAFEENQVALGQRFAPAVAAAIDALTNFIAPAKETSGIMVDVKASLIAVGLALSGSVAGVYALGTAWTAFRAAALALNAQLTLTQALLAGLGIGLLAIAVTELVLHFKQVSAVVQSFIKDLGQLAEVAKGVGSILQGAFTFDSTKIKQGLKEIGDAFKKIGTDAAEGWKSANENSEKGATEQIAIKKELADKEQALRSGQEASRKQLADAQHSLIISELKQESAEIIALKKQEIQELQALEKSKDAEERALLQQKIAQTKQDIVTQKQQDLQIQKQFDQEDSAARKQHGNDKVKITTDAERKEMAVIQANTDTQEKAQKKVYQQDLKTQQAAHNQFLQDQIKYGTAYAAINEAMHSAVYQGAKTAFGDLSELQQSSNSTLKAIGQVAAVANIVIKTAESAMNIYAGFSAIPIVGPALGIAGAAAAVAFGAEQISKVGAAQTGGLVGGVGYGDSQPYLLEPGELITPKKNFDEVVTSVAQSRGYESGGGSSSQQNVNVTIGFDGRDAQQVLTARKIEDQAIGTYRGRT